MGLFNYFSTTLVRKRKLHKYVLLFFAFVYVQTTIAQAPTINSFTPASGPVGSNIVISGSNFNSNPGTIIVYFGAVRANVTAATATSLNVTVPYGATFQPISVTVNNLTAYSRTPFIVSFSECGSFVGSTFASSTDLNTNLGPTEIVSGDIDGDGKPDLISIDGSNTVSVFRNTSISSTVSFANKVDFIIGGSGGAALAIGDIDGDGKLDVAVVIQSSNLISIIRNTSTTGNISFASKVDFATGLSPRDITVGDFNSDGKPDLAVVNNSSPIFNIISVLRNTSSVGIISFATKVDFTSEPTPFCIASGDLDGDGKPDLAIGNISSGNGNVSVLRNTSQLGNISFAAKVDFILLSVPEDITIGDLDGDGHQELSVTNQAGFSCFRNLGISGSISLAPRIDYRVIQFQGFGSRKLAINDLDGDTRPDMVVVNLSGLSIFVYKNASKNGNIFFAQPLLSQPINRPTDLAIADFNSDEKPDIAVVVGNGSKISVLSNKLSRHTINSFSPTSGSVGSTAVITGANFDPIPANNIVYFGAVKAVVNLATPSNLYVTVPYGATYQPITVTTNNHTAISPKPFVPTYSGCGNFSVNSFSPRIDFTNFDFSNKVSIGDFDEDGKPDLAFSYGNTINITTARNTSTPSTVSFNGLEQLNNVFGSFNSVYILDLDHDGKLDVANTNQNANSLSAFRNKYVSSNPQIVFAQRTDFPTQFMPGKETSGDFNSDGKIDLAITDGPISIFANTSFPCCQNILHDPNSSSNISFEPRIQYSITGLQVDIGASDFDGDGLTDIAFVTQNFNRFSIIRNIGSCKSIIFSSNIDFSTGSNPSSIAIGDIDGDGKPDIIITNSASNNISIFRNTGSIGNITFAPKIDITTGISPSSIAIGDLDGDGKPDITVANDGSNTISIFKNNSSSGVIALASKVDFASGLNPRGIAIADLDGDKKPDIVVANYGSVFYSVFRNIHPSGPNATIAYPNSTYCKNLTSAIVSLSGTPGGVFSSSAGLSLNSTTGEINPSLSSPGVFVVTYTIPASGGCSQFQTSTVITISAIPPTPVISISSINGIDLISSSAISNQWYLNGNILVGAINQTYRPSQNGLYTVKVTQSGCESNFSLPYNYLITSLSGNGIAENQYLLYPNPLQNRIFLKTSVNNNRNYSIKLINSLGQLLKHSTISSNAPLDISSLGKGIYFAQLIDGKGIVLLSVILLK